MADLASSQAAARIGEIDQELSVLRGEEALAMNAGSGSGLRSARIDDTTSRTEEVDDGQD